MVHVARMSTMDARGRCRKKTSARARICSLIVFCSWLILTCTRGASQINAHLLCEGNLQVVMWPALMVEFMSAKELPFTALGRKQRQHTCGATQQDCRLHASPLWLRSAAVAISLQMTRHTLGKIGGHLH